MIWHAKDSSRSIEDGDGGFPVTSCLRNIALWMEIGKELQLSACSDRKGDKVYTFLHVAFGIKELC